MNEKNKIIIHRLSWLFILLLIIFLPIIIHVSKPKLDIVDDEGYINDYSSSLNRTSLTMYVTFNRKVYYGYVTIKYYDDSNHLLETKESFFTAYNGKTVECDLIYVDGKVASYEIESFEFNTYAWEFMIYYLLLPAIIMFISSLLLCYREYDYNGKKISVYAGWYHHTIRVDGEKYDEHNTIMSFTPIKLNAIMDDNIKLEVTISLTNRITLKINGKLVK